MDDIVIEIVLRTCQTIGLRARHAGEGAEIEIGGKWCRLDAEVHEAQETDSGAIALIAYALQFGEFDITDMVLGAAENISKAVVWSVTQFVFGMVAPVASLWQPIQQPTCVCAVSSTVSTFGGHPIEWKVSYGQVFSNDEDGRLYKIVDQQPPLMLVWESVAKHLKVERPHWVKIYLCRYPDGEIDGEVRIDNELDGPAFQSLQRFEWPTDQPLIWLRQFGILMPPQYNFAPDEPQLQSQGLIGKSLSWLQKRALH